MTGDGVLGTLEPLHSVGYLRGNRCRGPFLCQGPAIPGAESATIAHRNTLLILRLVVYQGLAATGLGQAYPFHNPTPNRRYSWIFQTISANPNPTHHGTPSSGTGGYYVPRHLSWREMWVASQTSLSRNAGDPGTLRAGSASVAVTFTGPRVWQLLRDPINPNAPALATHWQSAKCFVTCWSRRWYWGHRGMISKTI